MKDYATLDNMVQWAKRIMLSRTPDLIIGDPADPYMHRWHVVPRNETMNVYLHKILRSDDDRALHDHPWWNTTWVLDGGYWEHTPAPEAADGLFADLTMRQWRPAGWTGERGSTQLHRLEIDPSRAPYAITLFTTGPKVREWGFQCPKGWVHWEEYTSGPNGQYVGRGCE